MKTRLFRTIGLAAVAALMGGAAQAQDFGIDWFSIDGGGGTSSGDGYSVSGAIGQLDAGVMAGGGFTVQGGFWSGVTAAQCAPLSIERGPAGYVVIRWPAGSPGCELQCTDDLTTPNWTPVPVGNSNEVLVPITGRAKFFRLHRP